MQDALRIEVSISGTFTQEIKFKDGYSREDFLKDYYNGDILLSSVVGGKVVSMKSNKWTEVGEVVSIETKDDVTVDLEGFGGYCSGKVVEFDEYPDHYVDNFLIDGMVYKILNDKMIVSVWNRKARNREQITFLPGESWSTCGKFKLPYAF